MQHQTRNGDIDTQNSNPYPLGEELRRSYGSDFKHVLMSTWISPHILTYGETRISKTGHYIDESAPEVFSLEMMRGTWKALKEPYSIILSESVAKAFFGDADPMDKVIKLDNSTNLKVTGVFKDLPHNTSLHQVQFMMPWSLYEIANASLQTMEDPWRPNNFQIYVQLTEQADIETVSTRIRDVKKKHIRPEQLTFKPAVFLHPMEKWHLYSTFKNGKQVSGKIENVWLFGLIGTFVLLLACINFMNLSTARSEKRAKEVGIRKAIGSVRNQLIVQFFSESFLVVAFAFTFACLLVLLILHFFNEVADKKLDMLWTNPVFWLIGLAFSLFTAIVAGSYPALYLSSFQPIKVLKGTFRVGRFAAVPRKVLVVVQFSVSIVLIVGALVVYRQIQFAKDRPVGYDRSGLITIFLSTPDIHTHFDVVRNELKGAGAIAEMAESSSPATNSWSSTSGLRWKGKDPALSVDFSYNEVSHDYGKTVGWKFIGGRDFSRSFASDSSGLVINEAAAKFMGLENPVGEDLMWFDEPVRIIGVIKDMIVDSPYEPTKPLIYNLGREQGGVINIRLAPGLSASAALAQVEHVFKKYDPGVPFQFSFVDQDYASKFYDEVRIAKLTTFFAVLAILISCLGLFGVASFIAEQRTKEIGVRKVLGATVLNVWGMLSWDFVVLVIVAFVIAAPVAYYFLNIWLLKYKYHTNISWWVFAVTGSGTLLVTLATVSFQAIKVAMKNPVRSLKSE
ncbi:FtsX-like permease family protein [Dyadobacter sp. Leaf189]|uniref:ABC transporter permease n=1 Tax=Dyadobacter sp. Leaf189 TaxID=1736295 RepID=UPI000A658C46|nr:FtsX-like permease family protein [Dyadobacter sp. Leaf189]